MSIPVATTTITVNRVPLDATRDEWDEDPAPAAVTVVSGVRAVIWGQAGAELQAGATHMTMTARLTADVIDLKHTDTVTDEATGDEWQVTWVAQNGDAFGQQQTRAGLARSLGVAT